MIKTASAGQKSALFGSNQPVMVDRGICFCHWKANRRGCFLHCTGGCVRDAQEEGNNDQDLHLLRGWVHCSLVSRPRPSAHEFLWFILPLGLPLCIQHGTENSVCLFRHKKVFACYCSIWVLGSGSQAKGEYRLIWWISIFTLLPDCWVTLGSLQLPHLSPPQFL